MSYPLPRRTQVIKTRRDNCTVRSVEFLLKRQKASYTEIKTLIRVVSWWGLGLIS